MTNNESKMGNKKEYKCELCNKEFKQKSDYDKHKQKKTPCINMEEIEKKIIANSNNENDKNKLITIFKYCLNLLRDNEALTGEKALRTISYFLVLKLIEPHLDNELNIYKYEYDFYDVVDESIEYTRKTLLENVKYSNLAKLKEENIINIIKDIWKYILSQNPKTSSIFVKNKNFEINKQSTFKKLIDKINSIQIIDHDIFGSAYEEVIKDIMTGKVYGQYFTQPLIKKMMIRIIKPQLFEDGKIETICDPTMGTGGFLISYVKNIIEQAKNKNIKLDWDFIINEGIYGKEIEPDTFQLAVSNMLISTGHMFDKLQNGDSIRDPITRKFDIILANPPFGIKGLVYDDFNNAIKQEYLPIRSDNAVTLFIQAIIYMLKINGRCAVVLPDGQDLFSKKNKSMVAVREYLMKSCNLKQILYLPSGLFENTSIKTCVFHFVKKKEGKDVITVNYKNSKRNNDDRTYQFVKTHQTHKVKFYDYNPYNETKLLLADVDIDKIAKNYYSLNYAEYIEENNDEIINNDDISSNNSINNNSIVYKTLGEVCKIILGIKRNSKEGKENGLYPLYYCSILGNLYLDNYDYTDEGIIINKTNGSGKAMVYYGKDNYNVGNTTLHFKSVIDNIKTKYIYYYLLLNIPILEKYYKGANQKSIVEDDLFKIKIPIPPLERQQEIVKYLDFIYEKANKTTTEKITILKQLNEFCLNNQKIFGKNKVKTLGEVCEIEKNLKKYDTSYGKNQGKYKFHTGGERTDLYVDDCDIKELYIIQNRTNGSGKCNLYLDKNFSLAKQTIAYRAINKNETTTKYIYYYLLFNKEILEKGFVGANHKNISKEYITNIKIHIPSLDRQKEIVEYCENNDTLIKQLEKEIEYNKQEVQQFMNSIIKTQNDDKESEKGEEINYEDNGDEKEEEEINYEE